MTTQELQDFLDQNFAQWVRALDLTVTQADPTGVTLSMPITDALARVGGIVSGQALAALADTSMVLAAIAHTGQLRPIATTDLHTQFLRPGVGTAISCHAHVVRAGKSLIFARADMTSVDTGKPVATASASFYVP